MYSNEQRRSVAAWLQLVFGNFLDILFLCCTPSPLPSPLFPPWTGQQGVGEMATALPANILCFTWLGNGSLRNYVVHHTHTWPPLLPTYLPPSLLPNNY